MSQQSTHYTGRTPVKRKLSGGGSASSAGSRRSGRSKGSRRSRSSRHDGVDDSDEVENPGRRGSYDTTRDTLGTTSLYDEGGAFYDSTIGDDGGKQKRSHNDEEDTGVEDCHSGNDSQGIIVVRGGFDDEQTHDDKTGDSDDYDRSQRHHSYGDNNRSPNRRDFSFRSQGDRARSNSESQDKRFHGGHTYNDRLGRDSDRSETHHAHSPRRSNSQHSRRRAPRDPSEMGDAAIPIPRRNTKIPGGPVHEPKLRAVDAFYAAAESTIASTASTLTFDTRTRSTWQTSLSSVDDNGRRAKPPPRHIDVPDPDGNRSRVVISNMPWGRKESSVNSAREPKWDNERHRSHSPGRRGGTRGEFNRSARTEGRDYCKRSSSRNSNRIRHRDWGRESFEEHVPMGGSREDDDRAQKRQGKSANSSRRPERGGSRARRDDGRARRGDYDKSRRPADTRGAGGRRSRTLGGRDYDRRARRDLRQRSDATVSSWRSIRYDVDDRGFCLHHPRVRLMRERAEGDWRTVRKKCPECIREDCPSMLGFDRDEDSGDEESRMGEYNQRRSVQQVRGADPPHDHSFQAVTSSRARHSSSAGGGRCSTTRSPAGSGPTRPLGWRSPILG